MAPEPSSSPISESFIGIGENAYTRGATELYLPDKFNQLRCEISLFEIETLTFREAKLRVGFKLIGDEGIVDNLYENDGWKAKSIRDFVSFSNPSVIPEKIAPVFCLMLNRALKVDGAKLTLNNSSAPVLFDHTPDILVLPNSYPPLMDLPEDESYQYYEKKATVFYASLQLNVDYVLEIDLLSNASLELAPLFPYGEVEFVNAEINTLSSGDIGIDSMGGIVECTTDKKFPDYLEERFKEWFEPLKRPDMIRAHPFRGTIPLFRLDEIAELTVTLEPQKIFVSLEDLKNYRLPNYQSIRFMFTHLFPHNKTSEITTNRKTTVLPVRIYDQLQYLPDYNDILVEYDILNMTREKQTYKIETEILGYTDKQVSRATVLGMDNDQGKPARDRISHCPRLKRGVIDSIVGAEKGTMICKVTNTASNEVIFEYTYEIDLLPKDQMIWEIRDSVNGYVYTLVDFICSWIRPVDQEGLLDKVRADSIKYHPDEALGHDTKDLKGIEAHVKAVYDCLQNEYKIKYLHQPFNSRGIDATDTQRVLLPEAAIKNRAGNCIDLTVLFASILEGFGIHSLLFITPDHAFIGWGNPNKTDEMFFLETTLVGYKSFKEAIAKGEEKFKNNFLFIGSENPLPRLLTGLSKGCYIVDVASVRKSGLVAKN